MIKFEYLCYNITTVFIIELTERHWALDSTWPASIKSRGHHEHRSGNSSITFFRPSCSLSSHLYAEGT